MQTAPLQPISSVQSHPGDLLQIDLVGKLQPSNGFIYILTEVDVFTRYLFAVPLALAKGTLSPGHSLLS